MKSLIKRPVLIKESKRKKYDNLPPL